MKNYENQSPGWNVPYVLSRFALIAILALSLPGCRTAGIVMSSEQQQTTTDSLRTVETLRDTVVQVKADSSLLRALIECDSLGQAHLKQLLEYERGDRLPPPAVDITNNVLTAKAHVDSMAIYLQLKDRYTERNKIQRITRTITQTVEVNRLTWWQTLFYRAGQILTAALIMGAVIKIYKLKRR